MTEKHPQAFWLDKCRELSPPEHNTSSEYEAPARAWLVAELHKLADHIERGGYPDVFGCLVPEEGPKFKRDLMNEWVVVLSHPWPG